MKVDLNKVALLHKNYYARMGWYAYGVLTVRLEKLHVRNKFLLTFLCGHNSLAASGSGYLKVNNKLSDLQVGKARKIATKDLPFKLTCSCC